MIQEQRFGVLFWGFFLLTFYLKHALVLAKHPPAFADCDRLKFNWWKSYLVGFRIQGAQRNRKIMTDFPCAAYSPACGHRVSDVWLSAARCTNSLWEMLRSLSFQGKAVPASPRVTIGGGLSEQYVRLQGTKPRRKIWSSLFYAPYFPRTTPFPEGRGSVCAVA